MHPPYGLRGRFVQTEASPSNNINAYDFAIRADQHLNVHGRLRLYTRGRFRIWRTKTPVRLREAQTPRPRFIVVRGRIFYDGRAMRLRKKKRARVALVLLRSDYQEAVA